MSRELLSRAWAAGAGPGDGPLTIDLDSTMCETYGLAKEGARHHSYTGQRGYHPLLAIAAGTGDVLMARLREGRANTVRGAAHFLRETVGRVRHAGATGQLTVRADSGFYAHALVAVCREMDVRFSITIRQHARLRELIETIPEQDWTPIPYWMDGVADVAETTYTPFRGEPDATPVRLIVRRVKPTPGSQLALFASYSYHGFITDREGDTLELEADHRRHAEIENAIRDLKYGVGLNHLPSGRFAANAAWLAVQVMAHNLAPAGQRASVWASRWLPPRPSVGASSLWPDGSPARRAASLCIFPSAGPGKPSSVAPSLGCDPCHLLSEAPDPSTRLPNRPANSRHPGPRVSLAASSPRHLALPTSANSTRSPRDCRKVATGPFYPESCPNHRPPLPLIAHPAAVTPPLRWIRAN